MATTPRRLHATASALLAAETAARKAAIATPSVAPHRKLGVGMLASGVGLAVGVDLLVPAATAVAVAVPVVGCCVGLAVAGSYLALRSKPVPPALP